MHRHGVPPKTSKRSHLEIATPEHATVRCSTSSKVWPREIAQLPVTTACPHKGSAILRHLQHHGGEGGRHGNGREHLRANDLSGKDAVRSWLPKGHAQAPTGRTVGRVHPWRGAPGSPRENPWHEPPAGPLGNPLPPWAAPGYPTPTLSWSARDACSRPHMHRWTSENLRRWLYESNSEQIKGANHE